MNTEEDPTVGLYDSANIPESNWFKFENVGDKVGGILVEIKDKPASGVFGPQRVFTLKQGNNELINVGISLDKEYVIGRANSARLGDVLGFEFVKEVPSATKGFSAAKSIEVYVKHAPTSNLEEMASK